MEETQTLDAIREAFAAIPFYKKLGLRVEEGASLGDTLSALPLLTRDKIRPTLPKQWVPEGRDVRAELASGTINVEEAGPADARVRILFDPRWWQEQQKKALALNPIAASTLASEHGAFKDAVLWTPERGTGSCGAGDPTYEDRTAGTRLHLNSRQDPTFWTEEVMTRMLDELALHETTALFADPFYLDVLARHTAILNRRLDVKGFIALMRARPTASHRATLAKVFPGTVIDVLASREVGTLFVQGEDNKLHPAPSGTHVELLPANVETPGAENVALVVVTTLRSTQPLVRYVLGDLVRRGSDGAVLGLEGTIDDAIIHDGKIVTPGAIDRAIGSEARTYQVNQTDAGIDVEMIGGSPEKVIAALEPLLGPVNARNTTAIAIESNGTYRSTRRRKAFDFRSAFVGAA